MNLDRERRIEKLFQDALDLPRGDRDRFLERNCDGDDALRSEVEELLDHHDAARDDTNFLAEPAVDRPESADPALPESIGPYRILRVLGEGGMGTVYLAEQVAPIRRTVALKVIRPGLVSREAASRFQAEQQALALMDHPGIARVFEAGTTAGGQSYFVMEYVEGEPITDYCDRERLDLRSRIELAVVVCDAVQHAHQRGILHRDLKPGNVLVARSSGQVLPKVIDFGIAKAIEPGADTGETITMHGQVVGTPEYMSPEQAGAPGDSVDTRTDVYSLGMLLYALLTGALPFPADELRRGGLENLLRTIREEDSPRPSDRASTGGARRGVPSATRETLARAARSRRVSPEELPRLLRGDLDWIVMKALARDREQRYASVSGLADDLRRYLDDEPVSAGPPSTRYRLMKFAKRHRGAVSIALVTSLLVLVFGFVMAYQAVRIAQERDRANREAAVARDVSEFLFALFEGSDPSVSRGRNVTAREILAAGAERIQDDAVDVELRGRLQNVVGRVYRSLGLLEEATPFLEQAVENLESEYGSRHPETIDAKHGLAMLRWNRGDFAAADSLLSFCASVREDSFGVNDERTLTTRSDLALVYWSQGRYEESEELQERALSGLRRTLGPEAPETLEAMNDLSLVHSSRGDYDRADRILRELLATRERVLGADHPLTLTSAHNLAFNEYARGDAEIAESLWRRTLEKQIEVLGENHQATLRTMGAMTRVIPDPEERERLQERVIAGSREVLGDEHPETVTALFNLGAYYYRAGRLAEAEPVFLEVAEIRERTLGPDHESTIGSVHALGMLYRNMKRYAEAERFLVESYEGRRRVLGDDHPYVFRSMNGLAKLYSLTGDSARAEDLYRRTLAGRVRVLGEEHPDTQYSRDELNAFLGIDGSARD